MTLEKIAEIKKALADFRRAPENEDEEPLGALMAHLVENVDFLLSAARQVAERPARDIPATNEIEVFFHCRSCIEKKPRHLAPREWVRPEVGWTKLGLQVWCVRCERNIIHVDFENQKHPANMSRLPSPPREALDS